MKDRTIHFEIDSTPVTVSYNREESNHFWDKKVHVFDVELDAKILLFTNMTERDLQSVIMDAIKSNEQPYELIQ
jgi:hypothetical protein